MEEAFLRDQIARMNASGLYDIEVPKVKRAAWLRDFDQKNTKYQSLPSYPVFELNIRKVGTPEGVDAKEEEDSASGRLLDKEAVKINEKFNEARRAVKLFTTDPEYAAMFARLLVSEGDALPQALLSLVQDAFQAAAQEAAPALTPPEKAPRLFDLASEPEAVKPLALPTVAPRLWSDRSPGTNAAQFLRETYAPWIEARVFPRNLLLKLDKLLYFSYAQWTRPDRHPEDAVPFAEGGPGKFIADPREAIERRRASNKASKERERASKSSPAAPF